MYNVSWEFNGPEKYLQYCVLYLILTIPSAFCFMRCNALHDMTLAAAPVDIFPYSHVYCLILDEFSTECGCHEASNTLEESQQKKSPEEPWSCVPLHGGAIKYHQIITLPGF